MNIPILLAVIIGTWSNSNDGGIDNSSDTLNGTTLGDVMIGDGFDAISPDCEGDVIHGKQGNDTLYGDTGPSGPRPDPNWRTSDGCSDSLYGDEDDDTLYGGGAYDSLYGGPGKDKLFGMAGADTLEGDDGVDMIYGGPDGDNVYGGQGNDIIEGNDGDDTLSGGGRSGSSATELGQDIIRGGNGFDRIYGNFGDDTLYGDADADRIEAGPGKDIVYGGTENDLIYGEDGDDLINGGPGSDEMYGRYDDDLYIVDNPGDKIVEYVGEGHDSVQSSVTYRLTYAVEDLTLTGALPRNGYGNDEDNRIVGNSAANLLMGYLGDDTLDGKLGSDTLNAGPGMDKFEFSTPLLTTNIDTITGFTVGQDRIRLSRTIFTTLPLGTLPATSFKIIGGGGVVDKGDRIIYNKLTGALFYDANGSDPGLRKQFAILPKNLTLSRANFVGY